MTIKHLTPILSGLFGLCLAAGAGCTGEELTPSDEANPLPEGNASGGEENTFDHPGTNIDPFELLERLRTEGPERYSSRVHSCPKMKYDTLGNLLASRGVNLGNTAANSAGRMWRDSDQALGAPNYAARQREARELTTATASKLFDIFVQAAPEVIAAMPNRAECQIAGVGVTMFNAENQCNADGIACLIGVPATASHLELCNLTVQRASDVEKGKLIAVATLLAAAHTCE
jgi:hypothetical protein